MEINTDLEPQKPLWEWANPNNQAMQSVRSIKEIEQDIHLHFKDASITEEELNSYVAKLQEHNTQYPHHKMNQCFKL